MPLVRALCQREVGFEPKFVPVGNTIDSLLNMVAAGISVAELVVRAQKAGVAPAQGSPKGPLGVGSRISYARIGAWFRTGAELMPARTESVCILDDDSSVRRSIVQLSK